ncbi:MAG TPA: response regulator [Opitutaceae bacterium]|nr:response regulator [Opitutaceae bacterium]
MHDKSTPRKVLLIEDSDDDAYFFTRAAKEKPTVKVLRVENGEEAKRYLLGEGRFADRAEHPLPDVIVSDLKMPHCSGTEFVKWLRTRPEFAKLSVTIVSSSNVQQDMRASLDAGADAYLVKPSSLPGYKHFWESLEKFWSHKKSTVAAALP